MSHLSATRCHPDQDDLAWAACGKPLVSNGKTSRSPELSKAQVAEGNQGAVSHRLQRAVENPCFDPQASGLWNFWAGDSSPGNSSGFTTALVSIRKRTTTTTESSEKDRERDSLIFDQFIPFCPQPDDDGGVGTFSMIKWVLFQLSRFRLNSPSGYFFDDQVGTFWIDKNRCVYQKLPQLFEPTGRRVASSMGRACVCRAGVCRRIPVSPRGGRGLETVWLGHPACDGSEIVGRLSRAGWSFLDGV